MKRMYLFLLAMFCLLSLQAQEGLQVCPFFNSKANVTEVQVKGKELKPFNLTLFRSLTLKSHSEEAIKMEHSVLKDAEKAIDKEEGRIGGRLYYGFYCLKPTDKGCYRYLFYRNQALRKENKQEEVTLVYMEGYATLDELKRMFK